MIYLNVPRPVHLFGLNTCLPCLSVSGLSQPVINNVNAANINAVIIFIIKLYRIFYFIVPMPKKAAFFRGRQEHEPTLRTIF